MPGALRRGYGRTACRLQEIAGKWRFHFRFQRVKAIKFVIGW